MMFHIGRRGSEPQSAAEAFLDGMSYGQVGYLYAHEDDDKDSSLHAFVVIPTIEHGIHSGNRRYMVGCVTCAALLHEATTGPFERIKEHLVRERGQ